MEAAYGGKHSVTAVLRNALTRQCLRDPRTGQALSEAMILGIGGGLGAGYILWEFEKYDSALIVLGFRNLWNYTPDFLKNACQRLNVAVDMRETASAKKAQANLDDALAASGTALLWADKASLPYQGLPASQKGHIIHLIGLSAGDDDAYIVDDLSERPWSLSQAELALAREPIPSNKQRSMSLTPSASLDLASAIRAGIDDHISHLSRSSESFSLPVYRKWAKLMTHPKNKKSWRTVFARRAGLYLTLRTIYEGIALDDTEGAGLRELYADFLLEAQAILDVALDRAAECYRACAVEWRALAEMALSDDLPVFAETKALMRARYAAFAGQDQARLAGAMKDLAALEAANNLDGWPLDGSATDALFERMSQQLHTIFETERSALEALKQAMQ
ncbi:MAG: DUF4872 domain-containing protein [Chloroflexota bacterium]|nr:DUF4872 domain-containing protein [Chloroflexota bacterium]